MPFLPNGSRDHGLLEQSVEQHPERVRCAAVEAEPSRDGYPKIQRLMSEASWCTPAINTCAGTFEPSITVRLWS